MDLDRSVLFGGLSQPKVLVMGLGESGLAIARWCAMHGASLCLADSRESPPNLTAALALPGGPHRFVSQQASVFPVDALDDCHLVAISPGLSPLDTEVAALLSAAAERNIPVWGELEFFSHALRALTAAGYPSQVIAITGTNGKTTTTALTGQLVARAGRSVAVAGNISPSMLDRLIDAIALNDAAEAVEAAEVAQAAQAAEVAGVAAAVKDRALDALPAAAHKAVVDDVVGEPTTERVDAATDAEANARVFADAEGEDGADGHSSNVVTQALAAMAAPVPARVSLLPSVWVLELSSFQLETAKTFCPDVATVLNVSQDHLDWHGGFEAYAAAKFRIFGATTKPVLNRADARLATWFAAAWTSRTTEPLPAIKTFGIDAPTQAGDFGIVQDGGLTWLAHAVRADGDEDEAVADASTRRRSRRSVTPDPAQIKPLMPVDALRIRGLHNASNALAALALCRGIGLPLAPLLHGLRDYRGEPHRVELIATVDDIHYVEDSKATNVGATVAALEGLTGPIVLIAGGDGKGQDFSPLRSAVSRQCKAVMLIGRDAPRLREALTGIPVPLHDQPTLEAAVTAAAQAAQAGDTVLLSPACASFDMFRNYAHRADVFRQCVEEIAAARGVML